MTDQKAQLKQITEKYFGTDTTNRQIAINMGNLITQQQVSKYRNGLQMPAVQTLTMMIKSMITTPEAKAWARDCIATIFPDIKVCE
jgi:hypothetical protein